jgi:hypothetical protein
MRSVMNGLKRRMIMIAIDQKKTIRIRVIVLLKNVDRLICMAKNWSKTTMVPMLIMAMISK